MTVGITFRPEALEDLADIFRFVHRASQNIVIAKGFVRRIKRHCDLIGDTPFGGRPRGDLDVGPRTIAFEHSAVIAYKVEMERVRITNVFYGGRDFEALYRRREE